MPELIGSLVVATAFLVLVVRDVLIAHGTVVRSLEADATLETTATRLPPRKRDPILS